MGALTLVPLGARLDARRARPRARARAFAASASSGRYSLGLDVGTQGTKAILYDLETHEVAGRGALSYGLLPAPGRPNAAEQDPETWMEGIRVSVAAALESARAVPEDIAAVGVSGQQHGLVCLDARGDVIRPAKLWCDTESAAEADELGAVFGWAMQAGFTSSKALWLKRNEPDAWDATRAVLLPHDYVNYRLTGVLAMEAGDASGVGVMDLTTRAFRSDWCDAVDPKFASTLPDLLPPDVSLGETVGDATSTLGVPAGVPVSVGSGDNMMSAIGAGCVSEGRLVVSLGTSGTLFGYSDAPVFDPTGAVAPFCDATGGYLPLLCTMNCTRVAGGAGGVRRGLSRRARRARVRRRGIRRRSVSPWLVGGRPTGPARRALDRYSTEISRVAGRDVPRRRRGRDVLSPWGAADARARSARADGTRRGGGRFEVEVLETNRRRHLRRASEKTDGTGVRGVGRRHAGGRHPRGRVGARVRGRAPAPVRGG